MKYLPASFALLEHRLSSFVSARELTLLTALNGQEIKLTRTQFGHTNSDDEINGWWDVHTDEHLFRVRHLAYNDTERQAQYQALRYEIFFKHLHWNVNVTNDGRECDQYDNQENATVRVHTVYELVNQTEHLVSGVRTFQLSEWQESMVMKEFHQAGMFSAAVLEDLQRRYRPNNLLEITRLCLRRTRNRSPFLSTVPLSTIGQKDMAQDLAYAAVYQLAEQVQRSMALAVVSSGYMRIMKQAGFIFTLLFSHNPASRHGYALVVIDLAQTIRSMQANGHNPKAERMLALCHNPDWMY